MTNSNNCSHVVITLRGGVVQNIVSDDPHIRYRLLDYDNLDIGEYDDDTENVSKTYLEEGWLEADQVSLISVQETLTEWNKAVETLVKFLSPDKND